MRGDTVDMPSEPKGSDGRFTDLELASWIVRDDGWWGSPQETCDELLARVACLSDRRAALVPIRNPRLLAWGAVTKGQAGVPVTIAQAIEQLCQQAYAGTLDWPAGPGPLEILALRVSQGILTLAQAQVEAVDIGARGDLITPYARAVALLAVHTCADGEVLKGMQLATLLNKAARGASPPDEREIDGATAWRWAVGSYVECARMSLCERPDGRLYQAGLAAASEVVTWGDVHGAAAHGEAYALLGCFLLDPHAAARDPDRYEQSMSLWRAKAVDADLMSLMPEPVDALHQARAAFEAVLALLDPASSGRYWKAYVQTLYHLTHLDPGGVDFDLAALARQALAHLTEPNDAAFVPFVELVLCSVDTDASPSSPSMAGGWIEEMLQACGPMQTAYTGCWWAELALQRHDPVGAATILEQLAPVLHNLQNEDLYRQVMGLELVVLRALAPPELTDTDRSFVDRMGEILSHLTNLTREQGADLMLGVACTAGDTNEENAGLQVLALACQADPNLRDRRGDEVSYLGAMLHYGQACNDFTAHDLPAAIEGDANAAFGFVECGLKSVAQDCLDRACKLALVDMQTAVAFLKALGPRQLRLESELGASATTAIANAFRLSPDPPKNRAVRRPGPA